MRRWGKALRVAVTALGTLVIALAFSLLTQVFVSLAGYVSLRGASWDYGEALRIGAEAPINLALAQAASAALLFVIAFPHRYRDDGSFLESVKVRPLAGGVVAVCFAAGLGLQLPLAELGNLVQEILPVSFEELARRYRLLNPKSWWDGMSALVAVVIVAPVTEELVFRGWLLPMLRDDWGPVPALVWTSVLFGAVHGPTAFLYATIGGLVLGAVALRSKSTLASIAMHAGINALPLLLPVSLVRIDGFNTLPNDVEHISPWLVAFAFLTTAGLLWVLWRATEAASEREPGKKS